MKKNSTFVSTVVIIIALGLILTYGSFFTNLNSSNNQPAQNNSQTTENDNEILQPEITPIDKSKDESAPIAKTNTYSYQGEEGKTAMQILKEKYTVETKSFDFGEMVQSINAVAAEENKNYWAFKVNGVLSMQGADAYQTQPTDEISWELTPLE
ncbi:MAG: hypothetical protein CEN89_555 [Candidatus Berkelbacteria bacterium Licking1014_7]|uniref:Transcobalamin-like C-terminal domain-containing protein n=1 Tax=Candidatus Berkelbacteria bacterium Licking1014_7 TaxID=2017147 RepID=A0A554LIB8_9BACT|nr:MAG: hypothetical protein CEN89_555 [Candidatus Berkelbacteria bacterium Licking1014_7]